MLLSNIVYNGIPLNRGIIACNKAECIKTHTFGVQWHERNTQAQEGNLIAVIITIPWHSSMCGKACNTPLSLHVCRGFPALSFVSSNIVYRTSSPIPNWHITTNMPYYSSLCHYFTWTETSVVKNTKQNGWTFALRMANKHARRHENGLYCLWLVIWPPF